MDVAQGRPAWDPAGHVPSRARAVRPPGARPAYWFPLAHRWRDRRTGRSTPLRGYLVTGLVLAVVTAALPLLAWGTPISVASLGLNAWSWLDSLWRLGTFALLAIGVGLARGPGAAALGGITAVYFAAVGLAGWLALQQPSMLPVLGYADPGVGLPAAVLLLSGLGTLLVAGLRELRR